MRRIALAILLVMAGSVPAIAQQKAQNPVTISTVRRSTKGPVNVTTTSNVDLLLNGMSMASIQLSGTFNATVNFQCTVDGTNFVSINMTPPNSATPVTSANTTGVWSSGYVGNCYIFRAAITFSTGTVGVFMSATMGSGTPQTSAGSASSVTLVDGQGDSVMNNAANAVQIIGTQNGSALNVSPVDAAGNPIVPGVCGNDSLIQNKPISIAASGYTNLVSVSGTTIIYVCGFQLVSTSAMTAKFSYGTTNSTACDTGATDLTGPMAFGANGGISVSNGGSVQFKTPSAKQLCINTGGTTQISGSVTFVQQ